MTNQHSCPSKKVMGKSIRIYGSGVCDVIRGYQPKTGKWWAVKSKQWLSESQFMITEECCDVR